jgi:TonB family protein
VRHSFRKLLPFVLTLIVATWGMARQAPANQDPTSPKETKVETPATVLKAKHLVNPAYPHEASKKHLNGAVRLHVFVATDGTVRRVEVIEGDTLLAGAAVEAAKQWTFEPPTVDGKPAEADTTIEVSFQILDGMACHVPVNPAATPPNRTEVEGRVMPLCLKSRIAPAYPAKAKKKHIEGTVKLRAIIATDGSVQHLEVEEGDPILAESALKAVKQWTYEPLTFDGKPMEVETKIVVNFELSK